MIGNAIVLRECSSGNEEEQECGYVRQASDHNSTSVKIVTSGGKCVKTLESGYAANETVQRNDAMSREGAKGSCGLRDFG
jgi:hypothetical protein